MKKLTLLVSFLVAGTLGMPALAGWIQNEDVKSQAEITSAILTTTGDLTSGSACVASPASVIGLGVGQFAYDTTHAYIPASTTVVAVPGTCTAGQIQLSANATGSATGDTLTFGGQISQLPNDTKEYVTAKGLDETLYQAITNGDIGGGGTWGSITGTLASQTDLETALNLLAPLASPHFSGNITTGTNSTVAPYIILNAATPTSGGFQGGEIEYQLNGSAIGYLGAYSGIAGTVNSDLSYAATNNLWLMSGGANTIKLDTSQNATFAGQIKSSVTTGTAPLVVASTTQVANLNAATAGTATTVTTNANMTGDVTSVGNATTLAATTNGTLANLSHDLTLSGSGTGLTVSNNAQISGELGLGTIASSAAGITLDQGTQFGINNFPTFSVTSSYGMFSQPTFGSTVLTAGTVYASNPTTSAASFTLPHLTHFGVLNSGKGSGSSVTNEVGFECQGLGIGTNVACLTDNHSSTGSYFINQSGTTSSVFGGTISGVAETLSSTLVATGAISGSNLTSGGHASADLQASNNLSDVGTKATAFNNVSPLSTKGDLITYSTTGVRQAVPGDYGRIIPDSTQTNGWRNATYTQFQQGRPGKNYIQYADLENGATTGWTAVGCATLVNGIPTCVGSGAAAFSTSNGGRSPGANTTAPAVVTSGSQIGGTYSLNFATSGAGTIGDGYISSAYAIDPLDRGHVLTYVVHYSVASGTPNMSGTLNNTYAAAVYDVANNAWLGISGGFDFIQSSGQGIATGTVQTSINSTSLQFFLYNPVAPTGASSLITDDFLVGPQTAPMGPAMTDFNNNLTFTPNAAAFGTITGSSFYSKREGDTAEVIGNFTVGTTTGTNAVINLPFTIDSTKLSSGTNATTLGTLFFVSGGATPTAYGAGSLVGTIFYDGSTTNQVFFSWQGNSAQMAKATGSGLGSSGSMYSVHFRVPVAGWSSNSSQSSDTDTRVIQAVYTGAVSSSTTNGSPIQFNTVQVDTAGAVTTGSSWRFIAPVTGYYVVSAAFPAANTGTAAIEMYKNGSLAYTTNSGEDSFLCQIYTTAATSGTLGIRLNAGDYIFLTPSGTVTPTAGGSISINRLSGPAVIAATESVNMSYTSPSGTLTSSNNLCTFGTKEFDSHNAYSSGIYTVPVSGKYRVSFMAMIGTTGDAASTYLQGSIFKNGSAYKTTLVRGNVSSLDQYVSGSFTVSCLAGDTLGLYLNTNFSSPTFSTPVSGLTSNLAIERIGN